MSSLIQELSTANLNKNPIPKTTAMEPMIASQLMPAIFSIFKFILFGVAC